MGRIAGDSETYEFRMVRMVGGVKPVVTPWGFKLRSSTSIIKNALAIPPSAMAYHGFREALKGIVEVLNGPAAGRLADLYEAQEHTPEALEELLKSMGITPNTSRDAAGDRGTKAHDVVELLALEWNRGQVVDENDVHGRATTRDWAEALAEDELRTEGTRYGYAGIEWWDTEIQPWIDSGEILDVVSERPVWDYPCADCGKEGYAGTLDLGILWGTAGILPGGVDGIRPIGWEIIDIKTHKPASGFTTEGKGAAYDSDMAQIRSYRDGWERLGLGETLGQRVVILRDRKYRGSKIYLEDSREVPSEMFKALGVVDRERNRFEGRA